LKQHATITDYSKQPKDMRICSHFAGVLHGIVERPKQHADHGISKRLVQNFREFPKKFVSCIMYMTFQFSVFILYTRPLLPQEKLHKNPMLSTIKGACGLIFPLLYGALPVKTYANPNP